MILLTIQTEHFYFQACGESGDQAGAALNNALQYHAEMYGLPENWHRAYDIERLEIEPGECFRDGQLLYREI
jgi:hypothetical protein